MNSHTTQSTQLTNANVNCFCAGLIADVLSNCGLEHAIISPGSRNVPLVVAFAENENIHVTNILDERSAAFFALGKAKSSHKPVALVCTSGTAGANYLPAIIEARLSHVPLIILTADRPPELRECHSRQTIDQVKLFGNHVNFYKELALPEADLSHFNYLRETTKNAFERSLFPAKGPIHLNVPFRDPLSPIEDPEFREFIQGYSVDKSTKITISTPKAPQRIPEVLKETERGLIILGTVCPKNRSVYCKNLKKISEFLGWPVFAEALSPGRNFGLNTISTYDIILRNTSIGDQLKPDFVLQIGNLPTSKVLRTYLEEIQAKTYILEASPDNTNSLHVPAEYIRCELGTLAECFECISKTTQYKESWESLDRQANKEIQSALEANEELFEGKIAYELSKHLPEKTNIFVASSMPVRDTEYFWQKNNRQYFTYFSRGANGIDGTLSTAMGVAHHNTPTVLLTGDLSLLHDTNGFLNVRQFKGSLTIILVNNDGGRIFENLPIAKFDAVFEQHVVTPQCINFQKLTQTYGVQYKNPSNWEQFRYIISQLPKSGVQLIEVKTNCNTDVPYRNHLFKTISNNAKIN